MEVDNINKGKGKSSSKSSSKGKSRSKGKSKGTKPDNQDKECYGVRKDTSRETVGLGQTKTEQ